MKEIRKLHNIYDLIMYFIISVWGNHFLEFMGIDAKITNVLDTVYKTRHNKGLILDFLAEFDDGRVRNIEFEFPRADKSDLLRFFDYNIIAFVNHGKIVDSIVINFTKKSDDDVGPVEIGDSLEFLPKQYYIGDCDFEYYFRNIKKKVSTYIQTGKVDKITPLEELAMLLRCVVYGFTNKKETLRWICSVFQHVELFFDDRFDYFDLLLDFELIGLISDVDESEIRDEMGKSELEVIDMSPELAKEISDSIKIIDKKEFEIVADENLQKGIGIGKKEGRKEGRKEGVDETFNLFSYLLSRGVENNLFEKDAADNLLNEVFRNLKK